MVHHAFIDIHVPSTRVIGAENQFLVLGIDSNTVVSFYLLKIAAIHLLHKGVDMRTCANNHVRVKQFYLFTQQVSILVEIMQQRYVGNACVSALFLALNVCKRMSVKALFYLLKRSSQLL